MFYWQRNAYNDVWASYIRMYCLMVILLRGGLELGFKGKGIIVFLYTFVPQLVEATMVMLIAWLAFGLPIPLAYALGFVCAAVSPAVLVPSMLGLAKQGFGIKKGIPTTLIAASSFDDIGAITLFGVFATLALNGKGGGESSNIWFALLANAYQLATGVGLGVVFGFVFGWAFRLLKLNNWFRVALCMIVVTFILVFSEFLGFHETKYIGIIMFGYILHCIWGHNKPEDHLKYVWLILMPLLFGSVGAAIRITEVKWIHILQGLGIFMFGMVCRFIATFLVGFAKKYTWKEKLFCALAWLPKATVQAAIGGIILDEVRADFEDGPLKEEYEEFGLLILTTSIISIVISAPLGAICTNTLGPKLFILRFRGRAIERRV